MLCGRHSGRLDLARSELWWRGCVGRLIIGRGKDVGHRPRRGVAADWRWPMSRKTATSLGLRRPTRHVQLLRMTKSRSFSLETQLETVPPRKHACSIWNDEKVEPRKALPMFVSPGWLPTKQEDTWSRKASAVATASITWKAAASRCPGRGRSLHPTRRTSSSWAERHRARTSPCCSRCTRSLVVPVPDSMANPKLLGAGALPLDDPLIARALTTERVVPWRRADIRGAWRG